MPLLLNYTDDPVTENEHTVTLESFSLESYPPYKETLRSVVTAIGVEKMDTVSFVLPIWPQDITALWLGEIMRETDWSNHPTHILTLVCSTPELYDAINGYFQGSWHL